MVTRKDGSFEYWEVTGDAARAAAEAPQRPQGHYQTANPRESLHDATAGAKE